MVEIQGRFFFQSDFVGRFAVLRDWGVLAVKAKGGVSRDIPLILPSPTRSAEVTDRPPVTQ